jgi:DNA-binding NarL/FixJ family response regulator
MDLVRVLVVDDSLAIRARLAAMLSEVPGVEVCEARGADEALAIARRRAPHVVLLDLHMPGKNGLAVLPELKAVSPPPIVVVLTSHPTEHHRRLCACRGADFFFDKSADFAKLVLGLVRPTGDPP